VAEALSACFRARSCCQGGIEQAIGHVKEFAMAAIDGRIAAFAARVLADNGMSPRCLANLPQRLEDSGKEAAGCGRTAKRQCVSRQSSGKRGTHRCAGRTGLRIRDFGRMGKTTVRPEHPARP